MPSLFLGRVALNYLDEGVGDTTLLLLHAFPLHSGMWAPQLGPLGEKMRILAPDARGFGLSQPLPDRLTMEMIADDAAALLVDLGIESCVVAGLSMGGYAALAFWRRHRRRVRALVFADTRATADNAEASATRESFARQALEKGSSWVALQMAPKLQRKEPSERIDAALKGLIRQASPEAVAAAQRGMAVRTDSSAMLGEIDCPVLVVVGSEDGLTPPSDARAMADALPNATLIEIDRAGHVPNVETAAEFNQALLDFVARV